MKLQDKIAAMCLEHFHKLPKTGKPHRKEWTVLSCIIQELNGISTVVALGTGSKCIGASKMSPKGDVLNDSHAEVICRRSFLRYLYSQMTPNGNDLLTFNGSKFSMNPNARFHFFTTHVPCGDAAIFPKQDQEEFGDMIGPMEDDGVPKKKLKLDYLPVLTGAKCLPHSGDQDLRLTEVYHVKGVVRTKPGRGDPTLSVSCSDKLAKWCHVGIQGALLSFLLESPIYLSSFTITCDVPFCEESLKRALYDRLEIQLNFPYHRKVIDLHRSELKFPFKKDDHKRPSPSSISWFRCDGGGPEVIVQGRRQGVTKKNIDRCRLKICKYELYKTFSKICESKRIKSLEGVRYLEAKMLAESYQESWASLRKAFKVWTRKDDSLLKFELND